MRRRNVFIFLSLFILFISTIFTLKIEISLRKFVDSYFIISGLTFSIFLFKYILDKGLFDTIRYSWQKSKHHILFFLPKYRIQDEEKNFDSFDDYLEYKASKKWQSLNWLLFTSFSHLMLSSIFSLIIYYLD